MRQVSKYKKIQVPKNIRLIVKNKQIKGMTEMLLKLSDTLNQQKQPV